MICIESIQMLDTRYDRASLMKCELQNVCQAVGHARESGGGGLEELEKGTRVYGHVGFLGSVWLTW